MLENQPFKEQQKMFFNLTFEQYLLSSFIYVHNKTPLDLYLNVHSQAFLKISELKS